MTSPISNDALGNLALRVDSERLAPNDTASGARGGSPTTRSKGAVAPASPGVGDNQPCLRPRRRTAAKTSPAANPDRLGHEFSYCYTHGSGYAAVVIGAQSFSPVVAVVSYTYYAARRQGHLTSLTPQLGHLHL